MYFYSEKFFSCMMYLFGLIDVNNIHLIGALKRTVHTDIVTVHVSTNSIWQSYRYKQYIKIKSVCAIYFS